MGFEVINLLPAVLLGLMIAVTLILLPHLTDETTHRHDEPHTHARQEGHERSEQPPGEQRQ